MALDRATEVQHLAEADRHIDEAELRVARQEILLRELCRDRHDTKEAERLLRGMKDTLALMREHRSLIVDTIARIDASLI